MDLVAPTQHSDVLLDQMFQVFPSEAHERVDVDIACAQFDTVIDPNGNIIHVLWVLSVCVCVEYDACRMTLAHGDDEEARELLTRFCTMDPKEAIVHVRKQLGDIFEQENPTAKVPKVSLFML